MACQSLSKMAIILIMFNLSVVINHLHTIHRNSHGDGEKVGSFTRATPSQTAKNCRWLLGPKVLGPATPHARPKSLLLTNTWELQGYFWYDNRHAKVVCNTSRAPNNEVTLWLALHLLGKREVYVSCHILLWMHCTTALFNQSPTKAPYHGCFWHLSKCPDHSMSIPGGGPIGNCWGISTVFIKSALVGQSPTRMKFPHFPAYFF